MTSSNFTVMSPGTGGRIYTITWNDTTSEVPLLNTHTVAGAASWDNQTQITNSDPSGIVWLRSSKVEPVEEPYYNLLEHITLIRD